MTIANAGIVFSTHCFCIYNETLRASFVLPSIRNLPVTVQGENQNARNNKIKDRVNFDVKDHAPEKRHTQVFYFLFSLVSSFLLLDTRYKARNCRIR